MENKHRRQVFKTIEILIALSMPFAFSSAIFATDAYPTQPIRLIVPFAPGGGTDYIGRFIAQRLTETLGQMVIVDNRAGAGSTIGVEAGRRAAPDGYTITMIAATYATNPLTYKLQFDPVNDVTPIILISQGPMILVANPKLPVKTIKELIAYAKSKPGQITAASVGPGSITHLAAEMFAKMAGIKLNHIQYKGSGPAFNDTLAGQTDIFFSGAPPAVPQIEAGRLQAFAVTSSKRMNALPNVPTIAESGMPGYEVMHWYGLIGPKGLPRPILERINMEVNKVMQRKETVEKLENDGMFPAGGTPEEFKAMIDKLIKLWKSVAPSDLGL